MSDAESKEAEETKDESSEESASGMDVAQSEAEAPSESDADAEANEERAGDEPAASDDAAEQKASDESADKTDADDDAESASDEGVEDGSSEEPEAIESGATDAESESAEDGAERDDGSAESVDGESESGDGESENGDGDAEEEPDISVADDAGDDEETLPSSAEGAGEEAEPDGIIEVSYYGTTDVGLIREHNEDNLVMVDLEGEVRGLGEIDASRATIVGERGLVLAVCDGMGGAAAGEVASQMAVDTIHEVMQAGGVPDDRDAFAHRLVFSIEEAGARIFAAAKMDRSRRGMGTTATVAGLIDKVLFVGQVGDSRCYLLRDNTLTLITKDQSLVNQLIEAGQLTEEEAEAFEHSNIILQALGTTEDVAVDLTFVELRRGDRIMLCSDGLSGLVHAEMIQEVLAESDSLPDAARQLIELANAGGGHDNITCITAVFDGDGLAAADPSAPAPTYMQYPLPPPTKPIGHSQPPREPTVKTGIRKPGADVKGAPVGYGAEPAEEKSPMPLILLALLLLAAVAYYVFVAAPGDREEPVENVEVAPTAESSDDEVVRYIVDIATDVEGSELFVDGESYGPLDVTLDNAIELEAGAYRVEIRAGGSSVRDEVITVERSMRVELNLPSGAEEGELIGEDQGEGEGEGEEAEDGEEPVDAEAAPEPEDTSAMETPQVERPTMMGLTPMGATMAAAVMRTRSVMMAPPAMAEPAAMDVPSNPFK
ncbi:MAG: protein phosphatase 2C domain-containing protein [Myxococcota bacterium]